MSLTVDPELARLIEHAKEKTGNLTASKAIRWALKRAVATPAPTPSVTLGLEIIKWAERLAFRSPKEQRELHELVRKMYEQLGEWPP